MINCIVVNNKIGNAYLQLVHPLAIVPTQWEEQMMIQHTP